MNIIHCIYDHIQNPWVGGGGAVRVYEIYRRLSAKHSITVVSGKYPGSKDYREGTLQFHFEGTDSDNYILSTFSYAVKAALFLKKHWSDADIIIEDFAPYNPLFSKFIAAKPVALQVHHKEGMQLFNRYFFLGLPFMVMESLYPRLFGHVICVSSESKKKFNIENAVVIPNGINGELFEISPSDGDYIAYLGRLQIHNKGLDILVKAMKMIDAKLLVAGRGKDELELIKLIKRSGISHKIRLIGFLSDADKKGFMAHAKFVVLPSRYEGQCIVVLEAAACGKPVIVSDIPELRYAVDAGFGIPCKTGDAEDLAEKIDFLLEAESKRKEMGKKAREYARDFTWDRIADEYERFLLKTII